MSFNNVKVGKVMGQGLVSCVAAWHVSKPQVVVMHGAVDGQQRHALRPGLQRRASTRVQVGQVDAVAHTAGTWDPPTAETEFQAVTRPTTTSTRR